MRVGVVRDSTACLPRAVVEQYNIRIVPVGLIFENMVYHDDIDSVGDEFYALLKEAGRLPTTSAPPPTAYIESFQRASQRAEAIVCVTGFAYYCDD